MHSELFKCIILLFITFFLFTACSNVKTPVIRNQIFDIGTLSTKSERRVVVVQTKVGKTEGIKSRFCAEPSPDVAETFANTFQSIINASAEYANIKPEASVTIARTLATAAQNLFTRTQGVQMFRDGLYTLCQAYLNGSLNNQEYMNKYDELLKTTKELVMAEIPLLHKSPSPALPPPAAPPLPSLPPSSTTPTPTQP